MLDFYPKQRDFLKEPLARLNFIEGAVRSGKTVVVNWKAIMEVMKRPIKSRGIICGDTYDTVKANVLMPMYEMVGEKYLSFNKNGGTLFGRTFVIRGIAKSDSETKIRGATFGWGIVDEVTLSHESFFDMLTTRMSEHGAWLMCTSNPDDPRHFIKTRFIDNDKLDRKVWHFELDDNTFLSPHYVQQVKLMYTGVFYERFILGKWVRAEGLIYRDFADHFRDYKTDIVPSGLHLSIGIDYGASKSDCKFELVGITHDFSKVYSLAEKRIKGVQSPEDINNSFIDWWRFISLQYGKCYQVYADYGALGQVLTRGLMVATQRAGLGIKIQDCSKGKIIDRIQLTLALMAQGRYYYTSGCMELVDAFCTAVWQEDKIDVRLDDLSFDVDSLDAFEYAIYPYAKKLLLRREYA
mgnify:CR=1 FL=1